ncbi:hypothetical protein Ptr902_12963 [Pyrenophora tritici-repentis]|nr:hypothetical protein Ptr902_12963 [Pyrenophora tritici-repentis]
MILIVAIPSYYLTSSYAFTPSPKTHPTTSTRYIALGPTASSSLATRNHKIAKDVLTWGWLVYSADTSLPGNAAWFAKYQAAAKDKGWEEDLWRIWQSEHGVRILAREKVRRKGERGVRGMVERVAGWVRREIDWRGVREGVLREWEEQRRVARGKGDEKKGEVERQVKKSESIISLKGSFMQRIEGLTGTKEMEEGWESDILPTVLLMDSVLEDGNPFFLAN